MSDTSNKRSEEFLKVSEQFQLGALTTEASHPATANLSETAQRDVSAALGLLFDVDTDVVRKYREFVESRRAGDIQKTVLRALRMGGRVFFTGCGATGRLSIQLVAIWRDFWQRQRGRGLVCRPGTEEFERRALSVMAGGDYALIKSVEGFEDFAAFGRKQIGDLGVSERDVVFAITEGGETSFVIGTAWKGVEAGAKVYFVYNNPDDVLCRYVERSREVIEESRIEKINLTTGPMAITGSTRMQATTIQLCVLLSVLEMVLRDLMKELEPDGRCALDPASVPAEFLSALAEMHTTLESPAILSQLAQLVCLEESVYRADRRPALTPDGSCFTHHPSRSTPRKTNYFADRFSIDVLTDTTERSPTYCTPPFRKFDDLKAAESWAFLFVPETETPAAWERILKRPPKCIEWTEKEVRELVGDERLSRSYEVLREIHCSELMRFKVGLDGMKYRPPGEDDGAVGIVSEREKASLLSPAGFHRQQLDAARKAGARTGLIYFGSEASVREARGFISQSNPDCVAVFVPAPPAAFLLDGVTRAGLKMLLNALSTCTMVRLGRVMGNCMIWVVPTNLKLIDRSTRYVQKLTGLDYPAANRLLFEVIEYIEPRMKAEQAYPPAVGLAVLRARHGLGNEEAERRLLDAGTQTSGGDL